MLSVCVSSDAHAIMVPADADMGEDSFARSSYPFVIPSTPPSNVTNVYAPFSSSMDDGFVCQATNVQGSCSVPLSFTFAIL